MEKNPKKLHNLERKQTWQRSQCNSLCVDRLFSFHLCLTLIRIIGNYLTLQLEGWTGHMLNLFLPLNSREVLNFMVYAVVCLLHVVFVIPFLNIFKRPHYRNSLNLKNSYLISVLDDTEDSWYYRNMFPNHIKENILSYLIRISLLQNHHNWNTFTAGNPKLGWHKPDHKFNELATVVRSVQQWGWKQHEHRANTNVSLLKTFTLTLAC